MRVGLWLLVVALCVGVVYAQVFGSDAEAQAYVNQVLTYDRVYDLEVLDITGTLDDSFYTVNWVAVVSKEWKENVSTFDAGGVVNGSVSVLKREELKSIAGSSQVSKSLTKSQGLAQVKNDAKLAVKSWKPNPTVEYHKDLWGTSVEVRRETVVVG